MCVRAHTHTHTRVLRVHLSHSMGSVDDRRHSDPVSPAHNIVFQEKITLSVALARRKRGGREE